MDQLKVKSVSGLASFFALVSHDSKGWDLHPSRGRQETSLCLPRCWGPSVEEATGFGMVGLTTCQPQSMPLKVEQGLAWPAQSYGVQLPAGEDWALWEEICLQIVP